jgi:hypothetical protein
MNNKQKGDFMSKAKNIYTITIISRETGSVKDLQTYSSKKYAESRLARLHEIYFGREKDGEENRQLFSITLNTSKLKRQARNMGAL